MDNKVLKFINKFPDNFVIIYQRGGFWGSVLYRSIAGSDKQFVWNKNLANSPSKEFLSPLEWPHNTEGFIVDYKSVVLDSCDFKSQHLTTCHIGVSPLKHLTFDQLLEHFDEDKKLIIKSHDLDDYKYFREVKQIRIYGDIHAMNVEGNPVRSKKQDRVVKPINVKEMYNLNINKLLSDNYDYFESEYLSLCNYLNCTTNISNVRSFILNIRERHTRFQLSLS